MVRVSPVLTEVEFMRTCQQTQLGDEWSLTCIKLLANNQSSPPELPSFSPVEGFAPPRNMKSLAGNNHWPADQAAEELHHTVVLQHTLAPETRNYYGCHQCGAAPSEPEYCMAARLSATRHLSNG